MMPDEPDKDAMTPEERAAYEAKLEQLSSRVGVPIDWARAIKPDEVLYLLDHCPFLQLVNPEGGIPEVAKVQLITVESSGWDIQYHEDAMSSSPKISRS